MGKALMAKEQFAKEKTAPGKDVSPSLIPAQARMNVSVFMARLKKMSKPKWNFFLSSRKKQRTLRQLW